SIRIQIASLLRRIEQLRTDENMTSLSLDELKVEVERNDILASGVLDQLIRGNLITADMATSLINDSAYVRDVTDDLIETIRTLFIPYDPELKKIEDDMALLKDEIEAILEKK
ncbi:MAG: Na/Pi cotransporter family protein, partial [Candidatus Electrothrix sp. LOE1_4_5]|nr:Na/Pi cotransporter family protein [Candidatus Electrothrix gigas]